MAPLPKDKESPRPTAPTENSVTARSEQPNADTDKSKESHNGPFHKLSLEVRLMIWEGVLSSPFPLYPVQQRVGGNTFILDEVYSEYGHEDVQDLVALMGTCRLFANDHHAFQTFYRVNTFGFLNATDLAIYAAAITGSKLKAIRSVSISLDLSDDNPRENGRALHKFFTPLFLYYNLNHLEVKLGSIRRALLNEGEFDDDPDVPPCQIGHDEYLTSLLRQLVRLRPLLETIELKDQYWPKYYSRKPLCDCCFAVIISKRGLEFSDDTYGLWNCAYLYGEPVVPEDFFINYYSAGFIVQSFVEDKLAPLLGDFRGLRNGRLFKDPALCLSLSQEFATSSRRFVTSEEVRRMLRRIKLDVFGSESTKQWLRRLGVRVSPYTRRRGNIPQNAFGQTLTRGPIPERGGRPKLWFPFVCLIQLDVRGAPHMIQGGEGMHPPRDAGERARLHEECSRVGGGLDRDYYSYRHLKEIFHHSVPLAVRWAYLVDILMWYRKTLLAELEKAPEEREEELPNPRRITHRPVYALKRVGAMKDSADLPPLLAQVKDLYFDLYGFEEVG